MSTREFQERSSVNIDGRRAPIASDLEGRIITWKEIVESSADKLVRNVSSGYLSPPQKPQAGSGTLPSHYELLINEERIFAAFSKDIAPELFVREYLVNAMEIGKRLGDDSGYKLLAKVLGWESDLVLGMKLMRYFRDWVYTKKDKTRKMAARRRLQSIVSLESPDKLPTWPTIKVNAEKYWGILQKRHRDYVGLDRERRKELIKIKDEDYNGVWESLYQRWGELKEDSFTTAVPQWVESVKRDMRFISEMCRYESRWNVNLSKVLAEA